MIYDSGDKHNKQYLDLKIILSIIAMHGVLLNRPEFREAFFNASANWNTIVRQQKTPKKYYIIFLLSDEALTTNWPYALFSVPFILHIFAAIRAWGKSLRRRYMSMNEEE